MVTLTKMEWVSTPSLMEPNWFLLTRSLYSLEQEMEKNHDSLHISRRFEYPWIYFNLTPWNTDDSVLDAGAGDTVFRYLVSKEVKEVYSIDTDAKSVDWAIGIKDKFPTVLPMLGDLTEIPFSDNFFDKIYCISVLEHLAKEQIIKSIEELIRVTKPNGKIAITMDVAYEKTEKQVDMENFKNIMGEYTVPSYPDSLAIFTDDSVSPPFPFVVVCVLMEKE